MPSLKLSVTFSISIPGGKASIISWNDQISVKKDRELVFEIETTLKSV